MNDFTSSMSIIIAYLLLNAIFSGVVAYAAVQKGRNGTGFFFLSFFLSFLVGILVVIAVPKQENRSYYQPKVQCPYCREEVRADAIFCKHCSKDLEPQLNRILEEESDRQIAQAIAEAKAKEAAAENRLANRKKNRIIALAAAGSALLIIAAFVIFSLSIPKPSPWSAAVKTCGLTHDYSIDGNTIELGKHIRYADKVCVLGEISYDAAIALGNTETFVGVVYDKMFEDDATGEPIVHAIWQYDPPYSWGTWTILDK